MIDRRLANKSLSKKLALTGLLLMLGLALVLPCACASSQQRPAITGIAFIRVTSADLKASRHFYDDLLGFVPTQMLGIDRYRVNELQWFDVAHVPIAPDQGRVAEIGFTTRDIVAMQTWLRAHSVAIEKPMHAGSFAIRDPEGHLVSFVQEHLSKAPVLPRAASRRLIHAGFVVRNRELEDTFYHGLLGFHLYWEGGQEQGISDWVNMQVPEGTDCVEYMLRQAAKPPIRQLGVMNHIALGVTNMTEVIAQLHRNGCAGELCGDPHMGREGKIQINLYDPDLTRVEFIQMTPAGANNGSTFGGPHSTETEDR